MNNCRSEKLWHKPEWVSDFDPAARAAWKGISASQKLRFQNMALSQTKMEFSKLMVSKHDF